MLTLTFLDSADTKPLPSIHRFRQDSVDLLCHRRWWNPVYQRCQDLVEPPLVVIPVNTMPLVSSCSAMWPGHLLFFTSAGAASCSLAPLQCHLLCSVPLQALPLMFYPIAGTAFCPPALYPVAGTASTSLSVRPQLVVHSHELWPLHIWVFLNMLTNDNHFSGAM